MDLNDELHLIALPALDCVDSELVVPLREAKDLLTKLESSLAEARAELAGNALMDAEAESFISGQELVPKGTLDELAEAREEIERLDEDGDKLRDALDGLLDGLDSNHDERAGLRADVWEKRIRDARSVLCPTKPT